MRRALTVGTIVLAAGLAAAPAAQADPRGGSIVGTGTAGTGTFELHAVAQKNGKFSGTASFQLAIGNLSGNVQFVTIPRVGIPACGTASWRSNDSAGRTLGKRHDDSVLNDRRRYKKVGVIHCYRKFQTPTSDSPAATVAPATPGR